MTHQLRCLTLPKNSHFITIEVQILQLFIIFSNKNNLELNAIELFSSTAVLTVLQASLVCYQNKEDIVRCFFLHQTKWRFIPDIV